MQNCSRRKERFDRSSHANVVSFVRGPGSLVDRERMSQGLVQRRQLGTVRKGRDGIEARPVTPLLFAQFFFVLLEDRGLAFFLLSLPNLRGVFSKRSTH